MDAGMKKLISARLQAQGTGPHPAPELLAAYAENSLLPHDRRALLSHMAVCADCREALYLSMPEVDMQPALRPSYKSTRLAVRWATLAASVVILGAVLLTNREMLYQHSPSVRSYDAAPSQPVAELKDSVRDRSTSTSAPAGQAANKVLPPFKHMTAKPQASMRFDQSGEVHFASAQTATGAKQISGTRVASEEMAFAKDKKDASAMSWSLSPDGDVRRSVDSGRTWQNVPVAGAPFRTITAIGDDIWAGGNAGALYHSADACQSWAKIDAVSADDITRIEFSDPRNGLLDTANGRVWSTSDGGRTWHLK